MTRAPAAIHAARLARDEARIAADLARLGPAASKDPAELGVSVDALLARPRVVVAWECWRCGDRHETAAPPQKVGGKPYCGPCVDHVRGVERESGPAPVAREPIQADTPPEAPACPIGEPAAPAPTATTKEEEKVMTATAERPKAVKASKPKPTTKAPRLCGCAAVGSHRASCKLATPPEPVACACGREFASFNGLHGHRRTCDGKPGARGARAAAKILEAAPATPPLVARPAEVHASAPAPDDALDFATLGRQIGELVARKQIAYGDSFGRSGAVLRILYPLGIAPAQFDDALAVVRVVDKLFRIATDRDALGESPFRDICGYALLATARVEREKGTARDRK